MNKNDRKKSSIVVKILRIVLLIIVVLGVAAAIYVNIYYKPSEEAAKAAEEMTEEDGNLSFYREGADTGFIIYPGGKVDERAYAVLARMLYEEGYTVTIVRMPFRLSIIDNYGAKEVIEKNDEIENWYLIGHSLGGTSASMYAEKYPEKISGIIFLGSYTYTDLSDMELDILVLDGDKDEVLNREKATVAGILYPQAAYIEIEGGNHAGFGSYGPQKGDGEADITWQEQHQAVVDAVMEFLL